MKIKILHLRCEEQLNLPYSEKFLDIKISLISEQKTGTMLSCKCVDEDTLQWSIK
jgi:hypothetical protein